jgi:hypothetical protein
MELKLLFAAALLLLEILLSAVLLPGLPIHWS